MNLYTWGDHHTFLAAAHAESVAAAREQLLAEIGTTDGSCQTRERAIRIITKQNPSIYRGGHCVFAFDEGEGAHFS
jgi:hypothetical protein